MLLLFLLKHLAILITGILVNFIIANDHHHHQIPIYICIHIIIKILKLLE